jgi:AcrR family transcriptional regulator
MEPRRTQAARSQAARDQIAQAALAVFALKGYAASSMEDICLAAGCSKGGLYHHFRTKRAVLGGVVDRLAARAALLPPFEPEGALAVPGGIGRVLLEIWAEAARDEQLRSQLQQAYASLADDRAYAGADLALLLRIGALVQLLTRGEECDAGAIASRLGIQRAA